jgi:hypothetical protein
MPHAPLTLVGKPPYEPPSWVPMRVVRAIVGVLEGDEILIVGEAKQPHPAPSLSVETFSSVPPAVRRHVPGLAAGDVLILHIGGRHGLLKREALLG